MSNQSYQSKVTIGQAEQSFNWRVFLPFLNTSRFELIVGMASLVVSTLLLVWASVILGDICALLGTKNFTMQTGLYLVAGFIVLEVFSIGAQFLGRRLLATGTNRVLMDLRVGLFRKLNELPMSYFDTQPMGRIITRLTNDVEGVEGFFGGGLARIATACVQIVAVLLGILWIQPTYGLWVVLSALPSLGFSWLTRNPVRYWLRENKIRNAHVNSTLAEFIQGLPVLRVLGLEKWSLEEFGKDTKHHLDSSIKVLSWNSFIRPITVFLSVMPTVVAVFLGGYFLLQGDLDLAAIVAVIRLTERFSNPVRTLTQEIQVIQDATASAVRVSEMLMEKGEVRALDGARLLCEKQIVGQIQFDGVHLAYNLPLNVLTDFNLTIPAGQKIGIIGATGAGKSSVINLIPGLYAPQKGRVLIDGVALGDWKLSALRKQIGYVAQEPFIQKGNLGDNLLGVGWQADKLRTEKFLQSIRACGLDEVLERFPSGLNYEVRENGSNLSSGEKQMIAFMRLLQEDRPILLMDEATSCLDQRWESAIQRAILVLMAQRKRTCVIIAHRLGTLRSCDRIVKLKDGAIVADGTPESVL